MPDASLATDIASSVAARVAAEQAAAVPKPVKSGVTSALIRDCLAAGELGDGILYATIHRDRFMHVNNFDQWYQWHEHAWRPDDMHRAEAAVEGVVDVLLDEWKRLGEQAVEAMKAGEEARQKDCEKQQSDIRKRVYRLRQTGGRKACLEMAYSCTVPISIRGNELDTNPMLFACANGVIDLETGDLRDGLPSQLISKRSNVPYMGITAARDTFERSLLAIHNGDEELVAFLRRLYGYALTGHTHEKVFPVLEGASGNNGKSVFIEALSGVFGSYAGPIPAEMLLDQGRARSSGSATPDIMALMGLRLAIASETDQGRKFSTAAVKWLTGGSDTLTGRGLHDKRLTTFTPTFLLCLLTNTKPHAPHNDRAFWRRCLRIPHNISFIDNPRDPGTERKIDRALPKKLAAEYPGILGWLVQGCLEWQRDGLNPPERVTRAGAEWQADEDPLSDFLDECVKPEAETCGTDFIGSTELYDLFCRWHGQRVSRKYTPSHKKFGTWMNDCGRFTAKKSNGTMRFYGIRLREDIDLDDTD